MVRFARAKGSKGSNERQPEEATSWLTLKQQMNPMKVKAHKDDSNGSGGDLSDDDSKVTTWAKFDASTPSNNSSHKINDNESEVQCKKKRKESSSELNEIKGYDADEQQIPKKKKKRKEIIDSEHVSEEVNVSKTKSFDKNKNEKHKKFDKERNTLIIGGKEVEVRRFDGFSILLDDWERLTEVRKKLMKKYNAQEVKERMKLDRRRAEKRFARLKKHVCYRCRKTGHSVSNCPMNEDLGEKETDMPDTANSGVCFKCGSAEHTHFQCKVVKEDTYKFAKCFVCKEQGHISRQCPDNPRGLYPKGGGCRNCGDVTHLIRNCPKYKKEQHDSTITLPTRNNDNTAVEALDIEDSSKPVIKNSKKKKKIVQF